MCRYAPNMLPCVFESTNLLLCDTVAISIELLNIKKKLPIIGKYIEGDEECSHFVAKECD